MLHRELCVETCLSSCNTATNEPLKGNCCVQAKCRILTYEAVEEILGAKSTKPYHARRVEAPKKALRGTTATKMMNNTHCQHFFTTASHNTISINCGFVLSDFCLIHNLSNAAFPAYCSENLFLIEITNTHWPSSSTVSKQSYVTRRCAFTWQLHEGCAALLHMGVSQN